MCCSSTRAVTTCHAKDWPFTNRQTGPHDFTGGCASVCAATPRVACHAEAAAGLAKGLPASPRRGGGARVERHEDALVEHHAAVAVGHADLAVGRLAVDDLGGRHVAGVHAGLAVEPHAGAHAHDERAGDERLGEVVHAAAAAAAGGDPGRRVSRRRLPVPAHSDAAQDRRALLGCVPALLPHHCAVTVTSVPATRMPSLQGQKEHGATHCAVRAEHRLPSTLGADSPADGRQCR